MRHIFSCPFVVFFNARLGRPFETAAQKHARD